jgi:hypothetical protein
MTESIYRPENIIKSESYLLDKLELPIFCFRTFNPKKEQSSLKLWKDHFKAQHISYAIVANKSDRWALWKHLNIPFGTHDMIKNKEVRGKKIKATCPRCGTIHKRHELWTGTTKPMFFCPQCLVHKDVKDATEASRLNVRAIMSGTRR